MSFASKTRMWAKRIKRDGVILWFAGKHPHTPWIAKALGVFVVAYALSPIDLIPDFIPVLGYLDDVILLPVLIWLTVRLLPHDVLVSCRKQADDWMAEQKSKPTSRFGILFVLCAWALIAAGLWYWAWPAVSSWFR